MSDWLSLLHKLGPLILGVTITGAVLLYVEKSSLPPCPDARRGYVPMASGIRAGGPLLRSDGRPCTSWPPGWPLLLAASPTRHAASIAMLAAIVGLAVYLRGPLFAAALLVVDRQLIWAGWAQASEPAFVFWLFVLGIGIERRRLTLIILGAGMAASTRYVGVALLAVGFGAAWLLWRDRWGPRLLFAAVAPLPLGLWVIRNVYVAGPSAFFGPRVEPSHSPFEIVQITVGHYASIIVPFQNWPSTGVIGLAILLAGVLFAWRAARSSPWLIIAISLLVVTVFGAMTTHVYYSPRFTIPVIAALSVYVYDGLMAGFSRRDGPRSAGV